MAASEETKFPPSFLGFKSQKFLHESRCDGVSGTDNDEQSLNNITQQVSLISSLAARGVLLISKRRLYTSCKRRSELSYITEDGFKNTYFC